MNKGELRTTVAALRLERDVKAEPEAAHGWRAKLVTLANEAQAAMPDDADTVWLRSYLRRKGWL